MKNIKKNKFRLLDIKVKSFQTTHSGFDMKTIKGGTGAEDSVPHFCTRDAATTTVAAAAFVAP